MKKGVIIALILLFSPLVVGAQHDRFLSNYSSGPFWEFTSPLSVTDTTCKNNNAIYKNVNAFGWGSYDHPVVIARPNGKMLFWTDGFDCYTPGGKVIQHGDSLIPYYQSQFLHDSFQKYALLNNNIYDTAARDYITDFVRTLRCNLATNFGIGKCYDSFSKAPRALLQSRIYAPFFSHAEFVKQQKNVPFFGYSGLNGRLEIKDITRIRDFKYRLILGEKLNYWNNNMFKIWLMDWQHGKQTVLDSFNINCNLYVPDSVNNPFYTNYASIQSIKFSRSGDRFFAELSIRSESKILPQYYANSTKLLEFRLDANNKVIPTPKVIFTNNRNNLKNRLGLMDVYKSYNFPFMVTGPDNEHIYLTLDEDSAQPRGTMYYYRSSTKLIKYNYVQHEQAALATVAEVQNTFEGNPARGARIVLNPYGHISLSLTGNNNKSIIRHYNAGNLRIDGADSAFEWSAGTFSDKFSLHDFIHLKKSVQYTGCNYVVNVNNESEKGIGFSKFKWYYTWDSTWRQYDSAESYHFPTFKTARAGVLNFRLHASVSATDGYAEWYEDTIHVLPVPLYPFISQTKPEMVVATMKSNNSTAVIWRKLDRAVQYRVLRNGSFLAYTTDTFFKENFTNPLSGSVTYHVMAKDACDNWSGMSNMGRTIFVKAEQITSTNPNKFGPAFIKWNQYMYWQAGVKEYRLEATHNPVYNDWSMNSVTSDTTVVDADFQISSQTEKCYRVIAYSRSGVESKSNEVCLHYEPVMFLPTAVTLNGDGLNDEFKLTYFGFETVKISIYNRWGQMVYEGNGDNWKPDEKIPNGVYVVKVTAAYLTKPYTYRSSVTLLR